MAEEGGGDRCDRAEKPPAEPVHAGDPAEHLTRHVALERAFPEHAEANEAESDEHPGDQRPGQSGDEPVHEEGDTTQDPEEIHRDARAADAQLTDERSTDRLSHADGRADEAKGDGPRPQGLGDQQRKADDERADETGIDE